MAGGEAPTPATLPAKGPGRKKLLALVILAVVVVALLSVAALVLLGGPVLALDRVEVSSTKTVIDQLEETFVSAVAIDTQGGNRTGEAEFSWSASPSSRVQIEVQTPNSRVKVTGNESGSVTVTARATWQGVTKGGNLSVAVAALHFEVAASDNTPPTGQGFELTVRAARADLTTATAYQGEVAFSSDDVLAELPPKTRFVAGDAGNRAFPGVVVKKEGPVRIEVRDTLATTIAGSITVTALGPANAPNAAFNVTRIRMHVDVDASATTDPTNDIVSYAWNWGDGTTPTSSAGPTASHDYATPGLYTIALTVTDAENFQGFAGKKVNVGPSTLDVTIWDMFNIPYREWWDYRAVYGDFPIGADCFSFESIPGGAGSPNPSGSGACDTGALGYSGETWVQYPYINPIAWANDRKDIQIYTPYRMKMVGADQPGATLAQPVYLPVFNSSEAPGTTLNLVWDFWYLRKAEAQQVDDLCGSSSVFGFDGFVSRNNFAITMDLQESKRVFGVVATTPAEAAAWWAANSDPDCAVKIGVERQWDNFLVAQGGSALTIGTYDLMSSYEWFYQPFMTNLVASVDPATGLTTVMIDHVVWGPEALFARYFYWGPTPYLANAEIYPHNSAGWWKWELAWFEDLHFDTTIGAASQAFSLETVMQYHLTAYANPGADGVFHNGTIASTDDIAEWLWQPTLTDYIYGGSSSPLHKISELDPYAGPDGKHRTADDMTYYYGRPGMIYFGTQYTYDMVPAEWDLAAGDTVVVRLPNSLAPNGGAVTFVDPYSPLTSDPDGSDLVMKSSQIGFFKSTPSLPTGSEASDSDGNGILDTVTLYGPIDWGAPGQPLWGAPALEFTAVPSGALASSASIAASLEGVNEPAGSAVGPFQAILTGPQALAIGLFMVVVYAPWIRPRSGGGWSRQGGSVSRGRPCHRPIVLSGVRPRGSLS